MKAMGRSFEAITALGMIGVMFAVGSVGFAMWLFVGLMEKLGIFQTDADRARIAADAAAATRDAAAAARWTPWVVGAEHFLLIAVCASLAVLALAGSVGFVARQYRASQVIWPKAGHWPIPRVALMNDPKLAAGAVDEYWGAERENAKRQLPPARQDIHVTGIPKDQVAGVIEEHHAAPDFDVLHGGQKADDG